MPGSQGGSRGGSVLALVVISLALLGAVQHEGWHFFAVVPAFVWALLAVGAVVAGLGFWAERRTAAGVRVNRGTTPQSREARAEARRVERDMQRLARRVGSIPPQ